MPSNYADYANLGTTLFYDAKEIDVDAFVCFVKFDTNQHYGCKTFNWRPRFFYNQTSSKCEMFWYDISCSKRREVTNMFYHRGVCKRLCEQSDRMTQKSSKRIGTDTYRIGKISAMFSQPYSSMRSNSHRKLIRMRNIFDGFLLMHTLSLLKQLSRKYRT
ncbi:hypothetical protein WUBG_01677 [Wuchereria bancrofti]|uniref:BPTI/Kunitz inhibitor domain-containing protein n=1 Tax=Wuchereria bancrofti TaxID=6293 RepID=J9EYV8_WUCBA|nr:hypothetical protein WUBG_01677 [Wuchereria bancrofti]